MVPAYAVSASALIAVLTTMVTQTEVLAGQVEQGFGQHPDVEIYRSQPGLGMILGARVLAEFGDDPDRYADAKARKNYSGMSTITKASGTKRVVLARYARNRRLGDALFLQAYSALRTSPGARAFHDRQRARGATHHQALRALASRLVGILHGCLRHRTLYDEHRAWHDAEQRLTAAARPGDRPEAPTGSSRRRGSSMTSQPCRSTAAVNQPADPNHPCPGLTAATTGTQSTPENPAPKRT